MRVNSQRSALSPAEQNITVGRRRIAITCAADGDGGDGGDGCVCARVCARVRAACAPVRVCARACMRACVCACVLCLQYTITYLMQADNNDNKKCYPIFHTHQTLW